MTGFKDPQLLVMYMEVSTTIAVTQVSSMQRGSSRPTSGVEFILHSRALTCQYPAREVVFCSLMFSMKKLDDPAVGNEKLEPYAPEE